MVEFVRQYWRKLSFERKKKVPFDRKAVDEFMECYRKREEEGRLLELAGRVNWEDVKADIMQLVKETKYEEMKKESLEKKNKQGKLGKLFGLKKKQQTHELTEEELKEI